MGVFALFERQEHRLSDGKRQDYLSLGQPHIAIWRSVTGDRTTLVLVAFVLAFCAFVFTGREARAQQQHAEATKHLVVIDGEVVEPAPGASSMGRSSVGLEPPSVNQRATGANTELTSPAPRPVSESTLSSELVYRLYHQYDFQASRDTSPAPVEDPGTQPSLPGDPESEPPINMAPESAAFEEGDPLPSQVEESPALVQTISDSEDEETYPLAALETTVSSTANALQDLMDGSHLSAAEDGPSIGAALIDLFSREEDDGTLVDVPDSPSTGSGSSSKDAPQPLPPPIPPTDSSSFLSLSSGGQLGSSGSSVAPLLLCCVLALGLILLPRDGRLSRAICELPKPSSALLGPLERPG